MKYNVEDFTSSVFLSQVGKPPDIAQPHRVPYGGQDEGQLAVPGLPLLLCKVRHPLIFKTMLFSRLRIILVLTKRGKIKYVDNFYLEELRAPPSYPDLSASYLAQRRHLSSHLPPPPHLLP